MKNIEEESYISLLKNIMENGEYRQDRTNTGTQSIFGTQLRFNIETKCPIITTKRIPWKSCIKELLWFLNGKTDSKILENNGVNIWKQNSSREFLDKRGLVNLREGDIGGGYGFQWRHFGAEYKGCDQNYDGCGIDQIEQLIHSLKNDPYSRRHMITAWNPAAFSTMALPPCHCFAQFYVSENNRLSCHLYQRSVDTFLGFPWNIMSYAMLTKIIALKCDLKPKELIISTGDTHIYSNHIDQVTTQIEREPYEFPQVEINDAVKLKDFSDITIDDFVIIDYNHHDSISATMAV
jgi:thymidylate synthase